MIRAVTTSPCSIIFLQARKIIIDLGPHPFTHSPTLSTYLPFFPGPGPGPCNGFYAALTCAIVIETI